jgi:hypothetical protein
MTAIPLGIVGAVLRKGYVLSLMGIVFVCGMVVNDLLVLGRLCEHLQLHESTSARFSAKKSYLLGLDLGKISICGVILE